MGSPYRDHLLAAFQAGLTRVSGREAVRSHLEQNTLDGARDDEIHLLAVGKAASSMTLGALDVLGARVNNGLMITKHDHIDSELRKHKAIRCLESDHPVPGEASLAAGRTLIEFIEQAPIDARFLLLISGGASSLAEVLPTGITLDKLGRLTDQLLATGLSITRMNQIRRAISCIKGGRLAAYLNGRPTLGLLISDVPGDNPAVIGSGPLTPVYGDVYEDAPLPDSIQDVIGEAELVAVPEPGMFEHISTTIVARLEDAKHAAADKARALGYTVTVHEEFLEGDAGGIAERLTSGFAAAPDGIHIWGGETAVTLPDNPGRGGRNQHLALVAARALRGQENLYLLSAGTDGTDGPTEDAGALVDGGSIDRGTDAGLDAGQCMQQADAGRFLEASGDLIRTGPTGTNVMDLVIGLKIAK